MFRWPERSSATWTTFVIWIVARFTHWCVTCAMSSTSPHVCWTATTSSVPAAYVAGPMTAASVAPSAGKRYEQTGIHYSLDLLSAMKCSQGIPIKSCNNSDGAVRSKFLKKRVMEAALLASYTGYPISCCWYYINKSSNKSKQASQRSRADSKDYFNFKLVV